MTTDRTYGDLHQWNVWHGSQEPWHNWDVLAGRFVSEFGMSVAHGCGDLVHKLAHSSCRQAYPNIRTVDYWIGGDVSERYPQSRCVYVSLDDRKSSKQCSIRTAVNHNKAAGFERRLELYLMENFKHAFDMERYDTRFYSTKCVLNYLLAMYTTPRSCRLRPLQLHIVRGEGTGRDLAGNTRPECSCGRWAHFGALLSPSLIDFPIDQRLLARDLLVNN